MTAFQAFLDDSGSGIPVFVLSGYVSSVDWWEAFSQFSKIKAAERNVRLAGFFELINHAAQASISSIIPISHYKTIIAGKIKSEWDDRTSSPCLT